MILGRFCLSCQFPIYYRAHWTGVSFTYSFYRLQGGRYHSISLCPWCRTPLIMEILTARNHEKKTSSPARDSRRKSPRYFPEWRPDENEVDRPRPTPDHDNSRQFPHKGNSVG